MTCAGGSRSPTAPAVRADLHVLPTLWYRNTWAWGREPYQPELRIDGERIVCSHQELGDFEVTWDGDATPLFCDNETNTSRLYGQSGPAYPKDGIGNHVIVAAATVNPAGRGTKAALWFVTPLDPGASATVRIRLRPLRTGPGNGGVGDDFDAVLAARHAEADVFHTGLLPAGVEASDGMIVRQAIAGLVWSQMFYHYNVRRWLSGDPTEPSPPSGRVAIRNGSWAHLDAKEVLLMPDCWEYPWFAAWDLAFHAITMAHADPELAKEQLLLLCREWLMHPNGQLPAYEWNFSDANPPVHAWAALEVFHITGDTDTRFLARIFHKLMLNFTWWVNQVDSEGTASSRAAFWAWTTSARSTAPTARPWPAHSSSPTEARGWPCTAWTCCRSPCTWPRSTIPTRTWR